MNKGKVTCETLKSIRKQVADANGIPYTPAECSYEGDCIGTCPNCERELQYIENQLSQKNKLGKALKIIGVATSMTTMVACQEAKFQEIDTTDTSVHQNFNWDYYYFQLMGASPKIEIMEQIDEMADFISLFPNDSFLVVGHTDGRGSLHYNKKLSEVRARGIRDLLINRGVDPNKIKLIGAATTEPLIPNAKKEDEHEQNSRVTLEFYSKKRENEIKEKIKNLEEDINIANPEDNQ